MNFEYGGDYIEAHEYPPEEEGSKSYNSRSFSQPKIDREFFSVQNDFSRPTLPKMHNISIDQLSKSKAKAPVPLKPQKRTQSAQKERKHSPFKGGLKEEYSARDPPMTFSQRPTSYESERPSTRRVSIPNSQNMQPNIPSNAGYQSLPDRLSILKMTLEEKNKEIHELKSSLNKLKEENTELKARDHEKTYETKQKLKSFNIEMSGGPQQLVEQYRSLYKAYEELVKTNMQTEESLRLEIMRGEEQRAYIQVLKQTIENQMHSSSLMPYLKKPGQSSYSSRQYDSSKESTLESYIDMVSMSSQLQKLKTVEGELRAEVQRLESKLKEVSSERDKLHMSNDNYHEVNEKLNTEVREMLNALTLAQNENMKLNEEKDSLLDYIDSTKNNTIPKADYERLTIKNEDLLIRVKEIEREYESLKLLSDEIDNQRKLAVDNSLEKERNLEQLRRERDNILSTLREREINANDKSQEIKSLRDELDVKNQYIKDLQSKIDTLSDNLATLNTTITELQNDLDQSQEKIRHLQNELSISHEKANIQSSSYERDLSHQQLKIKDLERELSNLHKKIEEGEAMRRELIMEKINIDKERNNKSDELKNIYDQVSTLRTESRNYKDENSKLRSENSNLLDEINQLKADMDERMSNLIMSNQEVHDLVKKLEEKDKAIKKLKEQANLLEKENLLLKNAAYRSDTFRPKDRGYETLREENRELQEKVESLTSKLAKMRELERNSTESQKEAHFISEYFSNIIRELNSTLDMSLTEDERKPLADNMPLEHSVRETLERKYREVLRLIEILKKEVDEIGSKYTQAKLDLLKEMERNRELDERETEPSEQFKQSYRALSHELSELQKERNSLLQAKESLHRKVSQLELQNKLLNEEMERYHQEKKRNLSQGNTTSRTKESTFASKSEHEDHHTYTELKLKEYIVMRLKSFIFNGEILELLDELSQVQEEIFKLEREKFKAQLFENHSTSPSMSGTDRKSLSPARLLETTSKSKISEMEENLDMLKVRKNSLENELYKIEIQEKRKYDSVYILEKQNFQLKNEITRLMNELEINFSKYNDNPSEYMSHKLSEKKNPISDTYSISDTPYESYKKSFERNSKRDSSTFNERLSHRHFDKDLGTNLPVASGRTSLKREDL